MGGGGNLNHSRFAYDILFNTDNVEELQEMLSKPNEAVKLHMNSMQTRIQRSKLTIKHPKSYTLQLRRPASLNITVHGRKDRKLRIGWSAFDRTNSSFKSNIVMR